MGKVKKGIGTIYGRDSKIQKIRIKYTQETDTGYRIKKFLKNLWLTAPKGAKPVN